MYLNKYHKLISNTKVYLTIFFFESIIFIFEVCKKYILKGGKKIQFLNGAKSLSSKIRIAEHHRASSIID